MDPTIDQCIRDLQQIRQMEQQLIDKLRRLKVSETNVMPKTGVDDQIMARARRFGLTATQSVPTNRFEQPSDQPQMYTITISAERFKHLLDLELDHILNY